MKLLLKIGCKFLLIIVFIGCNEHTPKEKNKGYFEDLGVLKEPVEFAKELSLPHDTWKGSISRDGSKFYFFRKEAKNEEDYRIYESGFKKGKWQKPKKIGFSNGSSDLYPIIGNDEKSMLFISYRPITDDTMANQNSNLWMSSYENGKWINPVFLDDLSITSNYESQPSVASNGNLYYSTDGEYNGTWESIKMFAQKTESGYAQPQQLESVNQWSKEMIDYTIYEICISPNEDYLIATISKKAEKADLYISKKEDEKWSKPRLLGNKINTTETENFPYITSNGKYLFFTRDFSKFYHISTSVILNNNDEI